MQKKIKTILTELKEHLPFSILSAALGIAIVSILTIFLPITQLPLFSKTSFHIFHPLHVLASATATTAMYWKYRNKLISAIALGTFGAIVICSISDILLPFIGGKVFGFDIEFHLCIKEDPIILIPFLLAGIAAGLCVSRKIIHSTIYSHTFHVILSTMASIFYLISFGAIDWINHIGQILIIVTIAVIIPCCSSDIVFPLVFIKKRLDTV